MITTQKRTSVIKIWETWVGDIKPGARSMKVLRERIRFSFLFLFLFVYLCIYIQYVKLHTEYIIIGFCLAPLAFLSTLNHFYFYIFYRLFPFFLNELFIYSFYVYSYIYPLHDSLLSFDFHKIFQLFILLYVYFFFFLIFISFYFLPLIPKSVMAPCTSACK